MRLLVAVLLLVPFLGVSQSIAEVGGSAVTYLFKNEVEAKTYKKTGYYVGPHILGDTITMLLNKFESQYVYFEETDGAYSVEEKKYNKPSIYQAISKINRYYEKGVKKGKIEAGPAYERMKKLLTLGVKLMRYQTASVEQDLKGIKDIARKEEYLLNLKFRS